MTLDSLPLVAVRWPGLLRPNGTPLTGTWRSFLDTMKSAGKFKGKDAHPGWSAVRVEPCTRKSANVREVSALVLDFDGGDPLDSVFAVWSAWAGLLSTTKSHTPASPRCRVILPFLAPVDAKTYARLWKWAEDRCRAAGLSPDKATKDPCRLWYLPGTLNGTPYEWRDLVGDVLDPQAVLASIPPEPAPPSTEEILRRLPPGMDAESRCRRYVEACPAAVSGQGGHTATLLVARAIVRGFDLHGGTARSILDEFNLRCVPPWSDAELDHKISEAEKCDKPVGYLLDAPAPLARRLRSVPEEPPTPEPPADLPDDGVPSICDSASEMVASLRSHSLASACRIVEGNACNVLEGKRLAFNEMGQSITLDGADLTEEDVIAVRCRIEDRISVMGKHGPQPITLSRDDVRDALRLEATRHRYHPVRDYLLGQRWDGVPRIDHVAEEVLHADSSQLTRALIRRWFVSAAARPIQPGCKVDTVLVLYGKTGTFKSTFFRTLTQPWFSDSPIDVHSKDAFLTLSRLWVQEWAELESLFRARDADAVKSFLSSPEDLFRPPYDRCPVKIRRTSVIVGSTNRDEFLRDDTGNRRWWPVTTGEADVGLLEKWRDQLWAEAVHALKTEQWWLTPAEDEQLADRNLGHLQSDAWREPVLDYVAGQTMPTTADVLRHILGGDMSGWGKTEEMRVSSILRAAGWVKQRRHGSVPFWAKP